MRARTKRVLIGLLVIAIIVLICSTIIAAVIYGPGSVKGVIIDKNITFGGNSIPRYHVTVRLENGEIVDIVSMDWYYNKKIGDNVTVPTRFGQPVGEL